MVSVNTISNHESFKNNMKNAEKIIEPQSLRDFLIFKYYKEKLSCEQIGNLLGVSATSVRRYMRHFNINLRNRNQIMKKIHEHENLQVNVKDAEYSYDDAVNELKESKAKAYEIAMEKYKKQGVNK